jgi:hypothetical protein
MTRNPEMSRQRQDCVNASADPASATVGSAGAVGGADSGAVTTGRLAAGTESASPVFGAASVSGEGITSTGAMKRYPLPETVSTKTGVSTGSRKA